jgi:DNA-binding beta-propeller fold protein YncE
MTASGTGQLRYELVEGWGQLPEGWEWGQVGGVAVDSQDRVHVFTRTEHPLMVFDREGKFLYSWGEDIFKDAHGICIGPDDSIYLVDRVPQVAMKFTHDGQLLFTMGNRDQHSDTGYTDENRTVLYAGPPFHHPTDATLSPQGEIYISDGYRNSRVHTFSAEGALLSSWGEPGEGTGQFRNVHSVWAHKGRLYVADRENNRLQVRTPEGELLETWPGFLQPTKIFIDADDIIYVAELGDRVSILDLQGNVLSRWGHERSHEPGLFWGPHGIWTDSHGDLYVCEVLEGRRVQKFRRVR